MACVPPKVGGALLSPPWPRTPSTSSPSRKGSSQALHLRGRALRQVAEAIRRAAELLWQPTVHRLFVVGVGGVSAAGGSDCRQQPVLAEQGTGLRVMEYRRKKKQPPDGGQRDGLALANWREQLVEARGSFSLEAVKAGGKPHQPVIVDCTSRRPVAVDTPISFGAGFHVVTPNREANTGSLDYYKALRTRPRPALGISSTWDQRGRWPAGHREPAKPHQGRRQAARYSAGILSQVALLHLPAQAGRGWPSRATQITRGSSYQADPRDDL